MTERLQVREIDGDEAGAQCGTCAGAAGRWWPGGRAQMVPPAQGMNVPAIAKVAFTSEDRVRDVIRNFNTRYFALDGTDHATHHEQASMIRRYLIWRSNHAYHERLRRVVSRGGRAGRGGRGVRVGIVAVVYTVATVSGAHINPAVTVGLAAARCGARRLTHLDDLLSHDRANRQPMMADGVSAGAGCYRAG